MTMSISLRHLPEVQAAKETIRSATAEVLPTSRSRRGSVAMYLLVFAFSAVCTSTAIGLGWMSGPGGEFWRSSIMVLAVLSGFLITTMVFTGKIDVAKSLDYSEFRAVSRKVTYLLLFQFWTLVTHVFCMGLVFLLPLLTSAHPLLTSAATVFVIGVLSVSVFRSLLVPIQIIEVHRFTHAAILRDKKDEADKLAKTL